MIEFRAKKNFSRPSIARPEIVIRGTKGSPVWLQFRKDEVALKSAGLIEDENAPVEPDLPSTSASKGVALRRAVRRVSPTT